MEQMRDLIKELTFDELCDHYCLLDTHLIPLLEVDRRTLKNWRAKDNAPSMARKLVVMQARGMMVDDWEGFKIVDDVMYTPLGQKLSSGDIMGWFYKAQMIDSLRMSNDELKRHNERLKQRITASNNSVFRPDGTLKEVTLK